MIMKFYLLFPRTFLLLEILSKQADQLNHWAQWKLPSHKEKSPVWRSVCRDTPFLQIHFAVALLVYFFSGMQRNLLKVQPGGWKLSSCTSYLFTPHSSWGPCPPQDAPLTSRSRRWDPPWHFPSPARAFPSPNPSSGGSTSWSTLGSPGNWGCCFPARLRTGWGLYTPQLVDCLLLHPMPSLSCCPSLASPLLHRRFPRFLCLKHLVLHTTSLP